MDTQTFTPDEKEIEAISAEVAPILAKVPVISKIESHEDEARASEFLAQITARYNAVEEVRKSKTAPLNKVLDWINEGFGRTLKPLKQAQTDIKNSMSAWRNSPAFKEAEAKRQAIENDARAAVRAGDTVALSDLAEAHHSAAALAPRQVETMSAKVSFRTYREWTTKDEKKVPNQYWCLDTKKIDAAVKAGVVIPGIEVTEVQKPVTRLTK